MELPGLVAVRWRRSNGAALVGPREGPNQRATDGLAPLPAIRWEGSPPRRKVDRSADGRHSVEYLPSGAVGGGSPDRSPGLRRLPAARWLAGAGVSVWRFRSYRSTRPVRGDRGR